MKKYVIWETTKQCVLSDAVDMVGEALEHYKSLTLAAPVSAPEVEDDTECVQGHYGSRNAACGREGVRMVGGFWYCEQHAIWQEYNPAESEA